MVPSRSQISTMSPVRSARSRRLLLASRHIRIARPFSRTSIRMRTPTTRTAAPPAITSASPEAGAPARPLMITTSAAMTTGTAAMIVAAPPAYPRSQVEARGDRPDPGREAEQARGADQGQLLKDPLVVAREDLRAHPQRVREGQRHQPDVGDHHPSPGNGEHGKQRAEHRQVRERVQQVLEK